MYFFLHSYAYPFLFYLIFQRFGCALVETGQLNLKNRVFAKDFQPIDSKCQCSTCKRYTRAYLHSIGTVEPVSCNHIQNVYVYKTFIWVHARTSRQKLHFNANFNLSILSNRLLELQDQTGIILQHSLP